MRREVARALSVMGLVSALAACGNSQPLVGDLAPAPPASIEAPLPIPVSTSAPQGRYLAADVHVHTDHSSDGSAFRQGSGDALPGNVSVADQIGQAVLAGLDWLPLTDHRTYDQHWDPLWTSDRVLLIPGEEANGRPHANIFGAVHTILNGARGEAPEHRATQWGVWDAHGQGAVFQANHANRDWTDGDNRPNIHASVLGIDVIEAWNIAEDATVQLAYAEDRWNRGFLTGITASSDNHFRELWIGFGPGTVHTNVFAEAETERAILNGLRAGRTVLTDGTPLGAFLTLEADATGDGVFEAINGDALPVTPGQTVRFRVRAQRALGMDVRIFAKPGQAAGPIHQFRPTSLDAQFEFELTAPEEPFWVRAEIRGLGTPRLIIADDPAAEVDRRALTAPIFLLPGGVIPVPETEHPIPDPLPFEDNARHALGERRQFTGFPDLVVLDGVALIVGEAHSATGTDVVFRRGDEPAIRLNPVAGFARFPRIAAAGQQVWVVWEDEQTGQKPRNPQIWLRGSADGGRTWGEAVRLTQTSGRAIRPALAALPDGRPVIAWSDNARRCFDLFVQVGLDTAPVNLTPASDKPCTPGTLLDTRSPRDPASLHPALTVLPDGAVVVVWQDNRFDINPGWTGQTGFVGGFQGLDRTDPDNWEILARRWDPGSGVWSPAVRVSNNGSDDPFDETALADRHPTLATTRDGVLLAAWESKPLRAAGVNTAIIAAVSRDGGLTWSLPELVGLEMDALSQRPAAATSPNGGVDLVWMDTRDADWRHRVWGVHFDGLRFGPVTRYAGLGNGVWPRVHGGRLAFASDRGAAVQRDPTWRVFERPLSPVADAAPRARRLAPRPPAIPAQIPTWKAAQLRRMDPSRLAPCHLRR